MTNYTCSLYTHTHTKKNQQQSKYFIADISDYILITLQQETNKNINKGTEDDLIEI